MRQKLDWLDRLTPMAVSAFESILGSKLIFGALSLAEVVATIFTPWLLTPSWSETLTRATKSHVWPWASAHRGKWGQLTAWKMDEKLKSENMQKEQFWMGVGVTRGWFQSWQCEFFERTKAPLGWTALFLDVSEETTIGTSLRNSFNMSYCVTISRNINIPRNNQYAFNTNKL